MRHVDSCYFCSTPYQIICAVSIVRQNHETADIYIFFDGAQNFIKELRKENIFSKVVCFKIMRKSTTHRMSLLLNALLSYIQYSKIAKEILIPNTCYDKFYQSNRDLAEKCCFFYYIKENIPVKRILFDDGAGSYFNDFCHYRKSDAIVRRVLFGKRALEPVYDQLLYSPDLYKMTYKSAKNNIKIINGEFDKDETKKLFNRIFQFKESDLINEDFILLDCMREKILDKQGQKKLQLIYNKIFRECGFENIIVKPHPRDSAEFKDGVKYYTNYKLPLECLYMNLNCNNKILISVSSTAVATPKIMFNQEPYVILLYKLLNLKSKEINKDKLDVYYTNCKNLYVHPERFMIPESEEELVRCLRQVKNHLLGARESLSYDEVKMNEKSMEAQI